MSAEKTVSRMLRRLVLWRLLGDIISLPRRVLKAVVIWLECLETAIFTLELEAARQYEGLTGIKMDEAVGEPERYEGLR